MLHELAITDLGVIDELSLVVGPGLTALTGETGAGKTMVVEALSLLLGGRADGTMVRAGREEAEVSGRFITADDEELILRRVIPRDGRSRSYINGRPATVSAMAEAAAGLVEVHGQHAQQALYETGEQRRSLDRHGKLDTKPVFEKRADLAAIDAALSELGGDAQARAREVDLYRYQVDELDRAGVTDAAEDDALAAAELLLAEAVTLRDTAGRAAEALGGDDGAGDLVGRALAQLGERSPFRDLIVRLRTVQADLADVAHELRAQSERIEEDPERLAELRGRRQLLRDLRRKYGPSLADVIAYHAEAQSRLSELLSHDARAAALDERRKATAAELLVAEAVLRDARQAAAPKLAKAVEKHLAELAMPKVKMAISVDGPAGDDVRFLIAANPGSPPLPLTKVASGGELSRTMLALRLVLTGASGASGGPATFVFDEVDAGVGGAAAIAIGQALAALSRSRQVLVVTHLPQVAAFADNHVVVTKSSTSRSTKVDAALLDDERRVIEVSRMLSGSPDSSTARKHAQELLANARAGTARDARDARDAREARVARDARASQVAKVR